MAKLLRRFFEIRKNLRGCTLCRLPRDTLSERFTGGILPIFLLPRDMRSEPPASPDLCLTAAELHRGAEINTRFVTYITDIPIARMYHVYMKSKRRRRQERRRLCTPAGISRFMMTVQEDIS